MVVLILSYHDILNSSSQMMDENGRSHNLTSCFSSLTEYKKAHLKTGLKTSFHFYKPYLGFCRSGVILRILRLYKYKYSICFISKESPKQSAEIYTFYNIVISAFCNSYDIFDPSLPTQSSKIVTVVNRRVTDWADHFTRYRQHSTHFIISKLFSTGIKSDKSYPIFSHISTPTLCSHFFTNLRLYHFFLF